MNNETKVQTIIIGVLVINLALLLFFAYKELGSNKVMPRGDNQMNLDNTEKETKKDDVEDGDSVNSTEINLSDYNSNISITNGGEYNVSGSFDYSIIIDADEKVTLNLNNVKISNATTAAIINKGNSELVLNLVDSSVNELSDGGSSEYDSCIYSTGKLTIEGSGTLNVYGNQVEGEGIATENNDIVINGGTIYIESVDDGINAGGDGGEITINDGDIFIKASGDGIDSNKNLVINGGNIYTMGSTTGGDSGIDTDDGYVINGGNVIALGSDMLENPEASSLQKSVSFTLMNKISSDSEVSLKDSSGNEITSFIAHEDFKTLIISNASLSSGTYYLYVNGSKTGNSVTIK